MGVCSIVAAGRPVANRVFMAVLPSIGAFMGPPHPSNHTHRTCRSRSAYRAVLSTPHNIARHLCPRSGMPRGGGQQPIALAMEAICNPLRTAWQHWAAPTRSDRKSPPRVCPPVPRWQDSGVPVCAPPVGVIRRLRCDPLTAARRSIMWICGSPTCAGRRAPSAASIRCVAA